MDPTTEVDSGGYLKESILTPELIRQALGDAEQLIMEIMGSDDLERPPYGVFCVTDDAGALQEPVILEIGSADKKVWDKEGHGDPERFHRMAKAKSDVVTRTGYGSEYILDSDEGCPWRLLAGDPVWQGYYVRLGLMVAFSGRSEIVDVAICKVLWRHIAKNCRQKMADIRAHVLA